MFKSRDETHKFVNRGSDLYHQQEYIKAEKIFQEAAVWFEKSFGADDEDTLRSKLWLGGTLYQQEQYSRAEEILREVVNKQENVLGTGHEKTLHSKYWLGHTLYRQAKYSGAEEVLRQVANIREIVSGKNHRNTLESKYLLGRALYEQEQCSGAEEVLRQVVNTQEIVLGTNHGDTLNSRYWLGLTLYKQKQYSGAEEVLRQVVNKRENVLGTNHKQTLDSKNYLGRTLYQQKQYGRAEEVFRQLVDKREEVLGTHHKETLESKDWLGRVLHAQNKDVGAEQLLQQVADGYEKTLGRDHHDTLRVMSLLQKIRSKESHKAAPENDTQPLAVTENNTQQLAAFEHNTEQLATTENNAQQPAATENDTQQPAVSRLDTFFSNSGSGRELYDDAEINEIQSLLRYACPQWSTAPRTYIVLRSIGHLNVFNDLLMAGFSDYWFPVTEQALPIFLKPSIRASIVENQRFVLTKSIGLEKGQHCHFNQGDFIPLEPRGLLGSGGFGQVDKVLSLTTLREYARKRVIRSTVFRGPRKEHMKHFIAEIQILKRINHRHIVKLVGSYTDPKYIGLIMSPVAEMNLREYLHLTTSSKHPELRTFFGCLATALEYLHAQKIRHKDIKPANVLINHGFVLLADFGLSLGYEDESGSTTANRPNGISPRYSAPEVMQHEPRNTKSDIWSLGIVFVEMVAVLKGKTLDDMDKFFNEHGTQETFIRSNMEALSEFIAELSHSGRTSDNRALSWIRQMLSIERHQRPTASSLVSFIVSVDKLEENTSFCGLCCIPAEEEFSDYEIA